MARILIVENNTSDSRMAAQVAREAGFSTVETLDSTHCALKALETALQGRESLPDAILVDLDLGSESGYEILRIRHSTPSLARIPVVVWTHLGDENRPICNLFNIDGYVSKWQGVSTLLETLKNLHSMA